MTGLRVTGLHKAYGRQPVLRGLDLTVPEGTLVAVLGPSGSGKTTLLRVVAGFERADGGTVQLGDTAVDDGTRFVGPEHRGIGYVSQEGSLFPHLTVEANVGFGLPRRRRRGGRVAELLAMVGLAGYERRYPHQLSGGQQQRVALARALAIEPALVLLDEPFAGLDAGLRAAVRDDVRRILRRAGTTAVLVTHDQDEALSTADRVAVIRDGRIAQVGAPADVYRRPADPEVARFLGEANLLPGMLVGGTVDTPLGRLPAAAPAGTAGPGTADPGAVPTPVPVLSLVRPEQVRVTPLPAGNGTAGGSGTVGDVPAGDGTAGDGTAGVVRETRYFGHDAVVTVGLTAHPDVVVVARVDGSPPAPGTAVRLLATGHATVWPPGQAPPGPAPAGPAPPG